MKKQTNYRSWSFRLLVYVLLLNILVAYLTVTYTPLTNNLENFHIRMSGLSILTGVLFIVGIVLTILSVKNKEKKDYKYKISMYGYPIFLLISIVAFFF